MTYCPSQDWDRHITEQDEAAKAEIAFYAAHRAEIVQVVAALLSNPNIAGVVRKGDGLPTLNWTVGKAAEYVREIVARGEPQ